MIRAIRHILFLLVALALVGGTTAELARAAQYDAMPAAAGAPCDMAGPGEMAAPCDKAMASPGDAKSTAPCKGLTADCIKQMGCVTISALPVPFTTSASAVRYATVAYWSPSAKLEGLVRQPEPQPPRTA